MAILQGDQGSVKFDVDGSGETAAAAIAGTRSWTLNVSKSTIEATQQGDTFTKTLGSVVSGSGTRVLSKLPRVSSAGRLVSTPVVSSATSTLPGVAFVQLIARGVTKRRIRYKMRLLSP